MTTPLISRHDVGPVTLWSLLDVLGPFPAELPAPFTSMTGAEWAEVRAEHPESLGGTHWGAAVRATLVRTPDTVILVDTGIGTSDRDYARVLGTGGRLPDLLGELGVRPEDVDAVVLTHPHADHVGWNTDPAQRPTFPRAHYVVHPDAWDHAVAESTDPYLGMRYFEENLAPLDAQGVLRLERGGAVLAAGVTLLDSPGHTPGHVTVHVGSGSEHALIVGDAAVHPLQLTVAHAGFFADGDSEVATTTAATSPAAPWSSTPSSPGRTSRGPDSAASRTWAGARSGASSSRAIASDDGVSRSARA